MSDQAKLKESLKKSIKALVISAPLGLTVKEVELDYAKYEGRPLPYRQLGYTTCQDFLQDIPDAVRSVWERGHLVVRAVADDSTRHIQSLVSRQKVDVQKCLKKRRASTRARPVQVVVSVAKSLNICVGSSSSSHQRAWRPGGSSYRTSPSPGIAYNSHPKPRGPPAVQPSVPAYVQCQLKTFLIAHPDGVQSSHFDSLFSEKFGHTICCTKLGFQSLLHMCQVLSDFIGIQKLTEGEFRIYEKSSFPGGHVSDSTLVNASSSRVNQIERLPNTAVESSKSGRQEFSNYERDAVGPNHGQNHQINAQWKNSNSTIQVDSGRPSGQNSRQENNEMVKPRERSPSHSEERRSVDKVSTSDTTLTSDLFETKFLEEIQQVLAEHSDGVWAAYLPDMYKEKFKKTLPMMSLGYYSVTELMAAMPEVVAIEREQKQGDWKLYDVRTFTPKTNIPKDMSNSEANATAQRKKTEVAADPSKGFLELKKKIRQILEQNSEGVYLKSLPLTYKKTFNEAFPLEELGLRDIESLVMMMPDVVSVVYKGYGRLLLVLVDESRTVPRHKSIPTDAVGWGFGYCYPDFPPLHDYIEVYVATVFTPHRLCIQLKNKRSNQELDDLMDTLESIYAYPEGNKYELPESMVAVGQICCALYLSDNNWHRAIITGIPTVGFIEVLYVDYGTVATVTRSALRLLKSNFLRLPVQAFNGRLAYIEPAEEKWSKHARDRLLALTAGKPLIALITEIQRAELYLLLSDTTTEEDIHINDALVEEGLARFESGPSEEYHLNSQHREYDFSEDEITQAEFELLTLQDVTESEGASGNHEYDEENYEAVLTQPEPDETLADSEDEDVAPSSLQNPPPGLQSATREYQRASQINNNPTPNDDDRGSNPSLDSECSGASDMPLLEESSGDGRWIVKRIDLDEGYMVHLINHENEVCLTVAEVTSFLCEDDSDPEEVLCCLVSELGVEIPLLMAVEKEHPRLFRELRRMEVLDSTDLSLDLVTMMPYTSALLLLSCSGTVSLEVVQQLQEQTEDLGVLGDMFESDVSDNAMDELGLALELDELKMTLKTLQFKRKRLVNAMMQNTDMNFVDELSHIEEKILEITKTAEMTEAIIQQRALEVTGDQMALQMNSNGPGVSTLEDGNKVTSPNEPNTGSLIQGQVPDSPKLSSASNNLKSANKLVMAVEPSLRDQDLGKAAQAKAPHAKAPEPEVYEASPPPEPAAVGAVQYPTPPDQLPQPDIQFPFNMPYAQFPNPEFVPRPNQYFPRFQFPPPSGYHHPGSGDFIPQLYPNQQSWMEPVPQRPFRNLPPPNLGPMFHVPPPRHFLGNLQPGYCPNSGGPWMPGPGQGQGLW